jgi:hypothetical protein
MAQLFAFCADGGRPIGRIYREVFPEAASLRQSARPAAAASIRS